MTRYATLQLPDYICDPYERNESHVGSVQVDKKGQYAWYVLIIANFFFVKFRCLNALIIILMPEMGSKPQY